MYLKNHSRAAHPRFNIHSNHDAVGKAPLKGLFSDGVWTCNCTPRLPAQHFQTKNGGKNHGRWFYTCQRPQTKRCDFFLWDDEAKVREKTAVLSNSRTEPQPEERTPTKVSAFGLPSPNTERHHRYSDADHVDTPYTPSKPPRPGAVTSKNPYGPTEDTQATVTGDSGDDEFFDWPASNDEEITKAVDKVSQDGLAYPPETPRKAVKSDVLTSPGKRRHGDIGGEQEAEGPSRFHLATPSKPSDDIFVTPATSKPTNFRLHSALPTTPETPSRFRLAEGQQQDSSELAQEILASIQTSLSVPLFSEASEKIKEICHRHALQTRGVLKGRDVLRTMVKKKEEQNAELQAEVDKLKSERETDQAMIRQLRMEVAARKGGPSR